MHSDILVTGMEIYSSFDTFYGVAPIYWDNFQKQFLHTSDPKKLVAWKIHLSFAILTLFTNLSLLTVELFSPERILSLLNILIQIICLSANFMRIVFELACLAYGFEFLECNNYGRCLYYERKSAYVTKWQSIKTSFTRVLSNLSRVIDLLKDSKKDISIELLDTFILFMSIVGPIAGTILTILAIYFALDPYVIFIQQIMNVDIDSDFPTRLTILPVRIILSASIINTTLRLLVVLIYLAISTGVFYSNLLNGILMSINSNVVLSSIFPRYNIVVILSHLIYLLQICGAVGFGSAAIILVLLLFITVKGFGKIAPTMFVFFPLGFIGLITALQISLIITQSVHDSSVEIKHKMKLKCVRRNGVAAKTIRSIQEIKIYMSIGECHLCYMKRSTKTKVMEYILIYSINLLLTLPGNFSAHSA